MFMQRQKFIRLGAAEQENKTGQLYLSYFMAE